MQRGLLAIEELIYGAQMQRSRKLIVIDYPEEIFIITGAEGSY